MTPDERTPTAYHEAGHVVAYLARGYGFRYVTMTPRDPAMAGRVAIRPRPIRAQDAVEIAYAGAWAETRHAWRGPRHAVMDPDNYCDDDGLTFGDHFRGVLLFGGGCQDYQSVSHLLDLWDVPLEHLAHSLDSFWSSIEAVARALMDSRRALTMSDVAPIVADDLLEGTRWARG